MITKALEQEDLHELESYQRENDDILYEISDNDKLEKLKIAAGKYSLNIKVANIYRNEKRFRRP